MYRIAGSVGFALIGLGLCTVAAAYPTEIKPVFDDVSAASLVAQRAIEVDQIINLASASDAVHSLPRSTAVPMSEPAISKHTAAPVAQEPAIASPAASGFLTSLFNEVPQPGVLAMLAIGAALCRFGSAFLGIRR